MAIVGFNFEKIMVEKKAPASGKIDVRNNVTIKNVEEKVLSLGDTKKDGLKFTFEFAAVYSPEVGNITINGHIHYLANQKKTKEILKTWEKENKLSKEIAPEIINTILMRCSVKSLNLAHDVNLPPNFGIPTLKPNTEPSMGNYIG